MSGKETASGGAGVGPNRRKWDMDEYGEKARQRDREEKERAQENEERIRKGQKPLQRRRQEILPKATETLQAREKDLEIEKNQGKTLMVEGDQQGASVGGGGKRGGPGFHCQACNRTFKDSLAYLDHVNGRLREFLFGLVEKETSSRLLFFFSYLFPFLLCRFAKIRTDNSSSSINIATSSSSFGILARRKKAKVKD